MARHAINVLVGASIGPLQKSLKQGVGLVKGFTSQAAKAASVGVGGFKTALGKAASLSGTIATSAAVGIGTAIGNSFDGGVKKASEFSGKLVKTLGVAGAASGAALAAGMKVSLSKFAEVETAALRLQTVLKGGIQSSAMMGQLQGFAQELATSTGTAKAEILGGMAVFVQAGVTSQDVIKKSAKAAANLAVAMGTDFSSAASQMADAQKSPRDGYLQLASAGMAFSESQISTIQSLQASGDLLGAQAALADAVNVAYGGAAEAAGSTLTGSMNVLWASISGVAETIGSALSPAIKVGVDMMSDWIKNLDMAGIAAGAMEFTAKTVSWVVDGLQVLKIAGKAALLGVKTLGLGAVEMFRWMVVAAAEVIEWIEKIPGTSKSASKSIAGFIRDIEGFQSSMVADMAADADEIITEIKRPWESESGQSSYVSGVQKEMEKIAAKAKETGEATKKNLAAPFQQITEEARKAQQSATDAIIGMKEELETFGLDDWQANANKLQKKGATSDQVSDMKRLGAQLKGKELAQSLETPFEKFGREMKKLGELHAAGGMDAETLARAKGKLVADLQGSLPDNKVQAGGAIMAGSQEARSALLSYQQASRNADPAVALQKQSEIQTDLLKQQNAYLQKMSGSQPQQTSFASMGM